MHFYFFSFVLYNAVFPAENKTNKNITFLFAEDRVVYDRCDRTTA